MVDNCYGEFVDDIEPIAVGADIWHIPWFRNRI